MTRPLAIAILGLAVRYWVSTLGYTQDMMYMQQTLSIYRSGGFSAVMAWPLVHFGPVLPARQVFAYWVCGYDEC